MKKPYVFISYSTKDSDTANLVHSYLEGNGIACWIASRNIEGGESFAERIVDAINDCALFVLISSENSNDSFHVGTELSLAASARKKVVPFRLGDFELSKSNTYFLQLAQWIDASTNTNGALKQLLQVVRASLPDTAVPEQTAPAEEIKTFEDSKQELPQDELQDYSRDELVTILLKKISKFPYCLRDRAYGPHYEDFKQLAGVLFDNTVSMYYKGRLTAGGVDYVDIIVDTLSQGQGVSIQVMGLPGCAKNMLLQLAYYKMLDNFRTGESDYLPIYLSSSYYEKRNYTQGKAREEMTELIREEAKEYFSFLRKNPNVRPVLMVEAVREHIVANFAPEDVMMDLWQGLGKFNRIIAMDVGLVTNRQRLKRAIPLMGDVSGYTFRFRSVPLADKNACMAVIRTILQMYRRQHGGVEAEDIYKALRQLRFPTLDIFTVRLVATELSQGTSADNISLVDMYERLALNELKGDEEKMLVIAHELYQYKFNHQHNVKTKKYNAVLWSLPHKHNTYLEFFIAYYAINSILHPENSEDMRFLQNSMTSMENRFMVSYLHENYHMQELLLQLVQENYDSFNIHQKSNAAYWLGKLTYAELTESAQQLLDREYARLLPLVEHDNSHSLQNRYNQFLFRSVCHGLISYGRTNVLDTYLCLLITNDITNAIDRGTLIQYMGDSYQSSAHNDFYLDENPNIGEQAIRILCSSVEADLAANHATYVETDLVSLLSLVQARMHVTPEKMSYNLTPHCEKCLELLREYQRRPRSVVSDKLLYYFQSVREDLEQYVSDSRFDAAYNMYTQLAKMKDTKRVQWLNYGIDDPESIAEHTINAWALAMIFLPTEYNEQNYDKQQVLDMLLIHDMAEAILGDSADQLCEPTKELKRQNELLRKLFLKGTYPEVANMSHYYQMWDIYYAGQSINARIARDINLIQTVNTFFTYFSEDINRYSLETVKEWMAEGDHLSTNLGYELFDRIIRRNPNYRKSIDKLITDRVRKKD